MSGLLPTPMIHLVAQPSFGTPSTSSYNLGTSEITTPSYAPYVSLPQNNSYFPFSGPPYPIAPPQGQPHAGVNFVHPSPIYQFKIFEQLNMENPAHHPNNSKKKGKTKTIITHNEAEIDPNRTNLLGATITKVTKILKGTIKTNAKGGTTTTSGRTSFMPFPVSMVIILTSSPKLSTSNG
jgi:hypothetical protein